MWTERCAVCDRCTCNFLFNKASFLSSSPTYSTYTVNVGRMSHRKWREIKQHLIRLPDLALLDCSLLSLHILCVILPTFTISSLYPAGDQCPVQTMNSRARIPEYHIPRENRAPSNSACNILLAQFLRSSLDRSREKLRLRFYACLGHVHDSCALFKTWPGSINHLE